MSFYTSTKTTLNVDVNMRIQLFSVNPDLKKFTKCKTVLLFSLNFVLFSNKNVYFLIHYVSINVMHIIRSLWS